MVDHTPATFVIAPNGRESRLYLTAMAYSSVNQLGYELAQSISALLPGHPRAARPLSLGPSPSAEPVERVTLPRSGGGSVSLGPGSGPHLVLFFDSWETEVTDLSKQLDALNRYQAAARQRGLPPLVAIDEADVEPSPQALPASCTRCPTLSRIRSPSTAAAASPTATRVQDSPWLELVSGKGSFLFYEDLAVKGWPTLSQLLTQVRAAQNK